MDEEHFSDYGGGRYALGLKPFSEEWAAGTYHMIFTVDTRPQIKASGMTIVVIKNE